MIDLSRFHWQKDANCLNIDPIMLFPEVGERGGPVKQMFCGTCPVRKECLTHALESSEKYGIWGGLGEGPRRQLISRVVNGEDPRSVAEEALAWSA